jgi:hypothetical protein
MNINKEHIENAITFDGNNFLTFYEMEEQMFGDEITSLVNECFLDNNMPLYSFYKNDSVEVFLLEQGYLCNSFDRIIVVKSNMEDTLYMFVGSFSHNTEEAVKMTINNNEIIFNGFTQYYHFNLLEDCRKEHRLWFENRNYILE